MSDSDFQYPQREQFFFNRFVREMADRAVASELGKDVFALLTIIAVQEDSCRYTKPVSFYSLPLMEKCGFSKFAQLANAREVAERHGWLKFVSRGSGSRQAASYFVTIPDPDFVVQLPNQLPVQCTKSFVDRSVEVAIERGIEETVETAVDRAIERVVLHTYPYTEPYTYTKDNTPLPPEGEAEASGEEACSKENPPPEDIPPTQAMRDVVAAWNDLPVEFARVKALTPLRRKSLSARLSDPQFRDNWRECLRKIAESDFCAGKTGGNWKASFDWFVNPNNFPKVLEGKYDNRQRASPLMTTKSLYGPPDGANIIRGNLDDLPEETTTAGSGESHTGRAVFADAEGDRESGP